MLTFFQIYNFLFKYITFYYSLSLIYILIYKLNPVSLCLHFISFLVSSLLVFGFFWFWLDLMPNQWASDTGQQN